MFSRIPRKLVRIHSNVAYTRDDSFDKKMMMMTMMMIQTNQMVKNKDRDAIRWD